VIHLTTIVFLYQKQHPEDGWITGRNVLLNVLWLKFHHKIKVHLLVFIHLTNLINARNMELIKTIERYSLSLSICIPLHVVGWCLFSFGCVCLQDVLKKIDSRVLCLVLCSLYELARCTFETRYTYLQLLWLHVVSWRATECRSLDTKLMPQIGDAWCYHANARPPPTPTSPHTTTPQTFPWNIAAPAFPYWSICAILSVIFNTKNATAIITCVTKLYLDNCVLFLLLIPWHCRSIRLSVLCIFKMFRKSCSDPG